MPFLKISTNLSRNSIPKDFVLKIVPVLSKALNKPEESFSIAVSPDAIQSVSKDAVTPSVVASLESIGAIGPEENRITARALTDFIEKELGVKRDRILFTYYNLEAYNVAKAGDTVA